MKSSTKIISGSPLLLSSKSSAIFGSKKINSSHHLFQSKLVNVPFKGNFHSFSYESNSDKSNGIDKQHLEKFRNQLRSEFKNESRNKKEDPIDEESDPKKLHTKFYREVGKPFIKVVALTFITFYCMKFLYAYLESTDEDIIKEKQIEKQAEDSKDSSNK